MSGVDKKPMPEFYQPLVELGLEVVLVPKNKASAGVCGGCVFDEKYIDNGTYKCPITTDCCSNIFIPAAMAERYAVWYAKKQLDNGDKE